MANFTRTRIYADECGQSHADDLDIEFVTTDFQSSVPAFELSDPIQVALAQFSMMPPGWVGDWHPAPRRQYSLHLAGELEVEVGDGRVCRFGPGSVVLLEDVSGKGHRTRVVGGEAVVTVFLRLP
jgi:quercetin dioxygenase-like cupin family protein